MYFTNCPALSIVPPLNGTPNLPFLYDARISAFTPTSGLILIIVRGFTRNLQAALAKFVMPLNELTTTLRTPNRRTSTYSSYSSVTLRSEEHTSELQSPVHLVCR